MKNFEYFTPLDIGSAFRTEADVAIFIEHMIDVLEQKRVAYGADYIPPIVYTQLGRSFNVHYNFLIECLSDFLEEKNIKNDFALEDGNTGVTMKYGLFLVASLFEDIYGVVRVNNSNIDLSRYSGKKITYSRKFYNILVYKNGNNNKRMSGVPFSESALKKMIRRDRYEELCNIAKVETIKQVAFGIGQFNTWCTENKTTPDYVIF
jgi:hypothetical protein